jgi:hypothetical protein
MLSILSMLWIAWFSVEAAPPAPIAVKAKEDWNFTPADYRMLLQKGQKLRFGKDSAWLPQELKDNLLHTLRFALDPDLEPIVTTGVSLRDLYHGHFACERPNTIQDTPPGSDAFLKLENAIFEKHGLQADGEPNASVFPEFIQAVKELEFIHGSYATRAIREGYCPRFVVLYHTFEMTSPPDPSYHNSRSNLLLRAGKSKPEFFVNKVEITEEVPDMNYLNVPDFTDTHTVRRIDATASWLAEFDDIFQFAFLVDRFGVVHATWGSTGSLRRVTGRLQ